MNRNPFVTVPELHTVPMHSPWHHVGMDFIGPIHPISINGNRYVLTLSDYFTKWVEALPLPSKCANGVAKSLFKVKTTVYNYSYTIIILYLCYLYIKIFMRMGLPKILTSDQGGEFRSDIEKKIMNLLKIKRHYITPYHPQV